MKHMKESIYKSSQYNIFFENKIGITLLYNTFTTALLKLTKEKAEKIKTILKSNDFNNLDTNEYDILIENGFIVENKINEIDQVRFRYYRGLFSNNDFRLTIVPTLDCNLNCPYCFETEKRDESITLSDCDEIKVFIEKQLESCQTKVFSIAWYGGEPLLKTDIIERISNDTDAICQKMKIKRVGDSIVTNGYLLTEQVAKNLTKYGINKIQLTLDGDRESHNQRRVLKNGKGTFDKILNAIFVAQQQFDLVTVRFNTNKSNYGGIRDLVHNNEIFKKNNVTISVGRLKNYLGGTLSKDDDIDCFTGFELQNIQNELDNFNSIKEKKIIYPAQIKHTNCGAENYKCFIVGPNCKVYKCAELLGVNDSVGYIKDGDMQPNEVFWEWFNYNIFNNKEKCNDCIYIPMCMGGCPSSRKRLGIPNNEICGYWEQWLKLRMDNIFSTL